MLNKKGVSIMSLVITMIVIIIIAMITFMTSREQITNAYRTAFLSELDEFNNGVQTYIERSKYYGANTFDSEELWWDGDMSHSPKNTAKIDNDDKTDEDSLAYIIGRTEVAPNLRGKIYINGGKVYVFTDKEREFEWAVESEKYHYVIDGEYSSETIKNVGD